MDVTAVALADAHPLTMECGVIAHGVVEASYSDIRALRDEPGPAHAPAVPPRFLRHAEEHTVVGLAAVLRAMVQPALADGRFDEWSVLAAQRFAGRLPGTAVLEKFRREGPVSVSPHSIPQYSLHSTAGAISVALGMHGPNFGVGGGRESIFEGVPAALSFFDPAVMPGLWLVFTAWEPDPIPDGKGSSTSPAVCRAAALALSDRSTATRVLRLSVPQNAPFTATEPPTLGSLIAGLEAADQAAHGAIWACDLPWGGRVELLPRTMTLRKAA